MEAYRKEAEVPSQDCVYTAANGATQPHPYYAQRAGSGGGLLLQDYHLIGTSSHPAATWLPAQPHFQKARC